MSESNDSPTPGFTTYAAFLVSDVVLLTVAWLLYDQAHRPMLAFEVAGVAACTAVGAWLGVWPFILRHRAVLACEERADLADTVGQINQLHGVAERVELATSQWQTAQEHATRAVEAAREIGDRITTETRGFQTFLEQAHHVERQHLELEVSKLKRAEGDWLQTLVRILDHVHSLFTAAQHSGQPRLAEQITVFQTACREAARRVGLVAHTAAPGIAFDKAVHQPLDPEEPVPEHAVVATTIGPGYTFQGRLLRRVVVQLAGGGFTVSSAGPVSSEPATVSTVGAADAPEGPTVVATCFSAPPAASGDVDHGAGTPPAPEGGNLAPRT